MLSKRSDVVIIDVRTGSEFNRGHIPGALNLHGAALASNIKAMQSSSTVAVVCHSGGRSKEVCQSLRRDFQLIVNVDGGTAAWIRAGLPIEKETRNIQQTSESNLRRQTHLVAGIMLITALAMAYSGQPIWFYLACLPAFGLMLDAITGICPMTLLLRRAPWNSGIG